jgi:translation initiation factor IF-2
MLIRDFAHKYNVSLDDIYVVLQEKGIKANSQYELPENIIEFLKKKLRLDVEEVQAPQVKIKPGVVVPAKEMILGDLADLMGCKASDVIVYFLKKGIVANKNKLLSVPQVVDVSESFGAQIDRDVQELIDRVELLEKSKNAQDLRLPIVVVMGHVDHGKTSFLDYIRKTKVAQKEAGGITQHLGAYQVPTSHGDIVFLDTPGHEAFSMMRERGALVADIIVLMVAADDGVMPQTKEVVKLAQSLDIPLIVAMNKADKASQAQFDEVKRQLADLDVLADDWGGSTPFLPISAKMGTGIDTLLEIVALQAEMMDLKTNTSVFAQGYILESKLEKGRGVVATVILKEGELCVGDYFISGGIRGKVNSIINDRSAKLEKVGPSVPVQIAGFEDMPLAGDVFRKVSIQDYKKFVSAPKEAQTLHKASFDQTIESINVLVKASTLSSLEAVVGQLKKIKLDRAKILKIIDSGVGDINENNIMFAQEAQALIVGLDVKVDKNAQDILKRAKVEIQLYNIIYKLVDDVLARIKETQLPDYEITHLGKGFVKAVFKIKSTGVVAGVHVQEGMFKVGEHVLVFRKGKQIAEGTIKSLQQERQTTSSVQKGNDCAFVLTGFNDWHEGDQLECISKKLKNS